MPSRHVNPLFHPCVSSQVTLHKTNVPFGEDNGKQANLTLCQPPMASLDHSVEATALESNPWSPFPGTTCFGTQFCTGCAACKPQFTNLTTLDVHFLICKRKMIETQTFQCCGEDSFPNSCRILSRAANVNDDATAFRCYLTYLCPVSSSRVCSWDRLTCA